MPDDIKNDDKQTPEPLSDEQKTLIQTRWRDAVDPDLGTDPSLADYKDLASVIKSHNSAQAMVGKKMADQIPNDDWDEKKLDAFYEKLGWSKDKAAYEFSPPEDLPEGMPSLQDDFDRFADTVIKNRIPKKQAIAVWKEMANASVERFKENKQRYIDYIEGGMAKLKAEFGQTFEEKRAKVPATLKKAFGEEFMEYLKNSGTIHHPEMIRAGMILTDHFSEDKANGPGERNSMGNLRPAEAESMANKMLGDKNHPLNDRNHPEHDDAVEKFSKLMAVASGGKA